jgi:tRNA A37 threonylcarbamoyladenosine synthetase subunit TsaC/SUA5/YrdC
MFKDLVYFVQTDTTVGFLSQNPSSLSKAKQRLEGKSYIKAVASNTKLPRVPNRHKNQIRRAKKTTFIYPNNESYRVIKDEHKEFVKKFGFIYSTSANKSGEGYDLTYALNNADVVVYTKAGFKAKGASKLVKLYKGGCKRLR